MKIPLHNEFAIIFPVFSSYFFLVHLLHQIQSVSSPQPTLPRSRSQTSISEYLIFEPPPHPDVPLCDRSKIIDKSEDVHDVCDKECADVTKAIDEFYTRYGHYSLVTWLHKRCGFITKGNCDFLFREYFPMCYCLTPIDGAGHRSNYALTCRYAITGIRNVLNAAIYARQEEDRRLRQVRQERLRKLRERKEP